MASNIKARRITDSSPPNTFCVLMLLIRIGVSAVLKFVKLMPAITTITIAIANNTNKVCLLDLGVVSY